MKKFYMIAFFLISFLGKGQAALPDPRVDQLQAQVNSLDTNGTKSLNQMRNDLNSKLDKIEKELGFMTKSLTDENIGVLKVLNEIKENLNNKANAEKTPIFLTQEIDRIWGLYNGNNDNLSAQLNNIVNRLNQEISKLKLKPNLENDKSIKGLKDQIRSNMEKYNQSVIQSGNFKKNSQNPENKNLKLAEILYSILKDRIQTINEHLENAKEDLRNLKTLNQNELKK